MKAEKREWSLASLLLGIFCSVLFFATFVFKGRNYIFLMALAAIHAIFTGHLARRREKDTPQEKESINWVVTILIGAIWLSAVGYFMKHGWLLFPFIGVLALIMAGIAYILTKPRRISVTGICALLGLNLGYIAVAVVIYAFTVLPYRQKQGIMAFDAKVKTALEAERTEKPNFEGRTIDLTPYYNYHLTDCLFPGKIRKEDNLAEMPSGSHVFAGIPFQVGGMLMLSGRLAVGYKIQLPREVAIPIKGKCLQLDLLQGLMGGHDNGRAVAKLVLDYADGSKREIKIIRGEHVLDFWGYLNEKPTGAGSELAWCGQNEEIKRDWKGNGWLRLYKSSFPNPEPKSEITNLTYASTMSDSSVFLVALTVE